MYLYSYLKDEHQSNIIISKKQFRTCSKGSRINTTSTPPIFKN